MSTKIFFMALIAAQFLSQAAYSNPHTCASERVQFPGRAMEGEPKQTRLPQFIDANRLVRSESSWTIAKGPGVVLPIGFEVGDISFSLNGVLCEGQQVLLPSLQDNLDLADNLEFYISPKSSMAFGAHVSASGEQARLFLADDRGKKIANYILPRVGIGSRVTQAVAFTADGSSVVFEVIGVGNSRDIIWLNFQDATLRLITPSGAWDHTSWMPELQSLHTDDLGIHSITFKNGPQTTEMSFDDAILISKYEYWLEAQ